MELLKKMFPLILDIKNANRLQNFFQNSAKERVTSFNISATVKRRRDNNNTNNTSDTDYNGNTRYFHDTDI